MNEHCVAMIIFYVYVSVSAHTYFLGETYHKIYDVHKRRRCGAAGSVSPSDYSNTQAGEYKRTHTNVRMYILYIECL